MGSVCCAEKQDEPNAVIEKERELEDEETAKSKYGKSMIFTVVIAVAVFLTILVSSTRRICVLFNSIVQICLIMKLTI